MYFEGEVDGAGQDAVLDEPMRNTLRLCQDRGDGWMEVEMGHFFNDGGVDHGAVVFSLMEIDNYTSKSGLIVEGIELRPKAAGR